MRKNTKTLKQVELSFIQGYHATNRDGEQYAYDGFKSRKYFTNDRSIELDENYNRADGKPLKGYGLEIETECFRIHDRTVYAEILNKIIFTHFPKDLFKLQRDGSLGGDTSAECITQPMTREFIRNNYANFKLMYDTYFRAFTIDCANSGNCGMHVNISVGCFGRDITKQTEAIKKLAYIINKHYVLMCALLKRDRNHTQYCGLMPIFCDKQIAKKVSLSDFDCSHGVCFNLGHYNAGRVELRLVGGQQNFNAFRGTLETVFFLVDRVKDITWNECDDLTKIFDGVNVHVLKRIAYCSSYLTAEQFEKISGRATSEKFTLSEE